MHRIVKCCRSFYYLNLNGSGKETLRLLLIKGECIYPSYKLLYHESIALWLTFNSHHKVWISDSDCIINWCPIHSKRPCLFLRLKNKKKNQVRRKAKNMHCRWKDVLSLIDTGIKSPWRIVLKWWHFYSIKSFLKKQQQQLAKCKHNEPNTQNLSEQRCSWAAVLQP